MRYCALIFCLFLFVQCVSIPYYKKTLPSKHTSSSIFLHKYLKKITKKNKNLKNICIITNQSMLGSYLFKPSKKEGFQSYLHEVLSLYKIKLNYIFTPEHGLTGLEKEAGQYHRLKNNIQTRVIYKKKMPFLKKVFQSCQNIAFSLPDVGIRPYTYRNILERSLKAFNSLYKNTQKTHFFWVLDAPNLASFLKPRGPIAHPRLYSHLGEEEIPFFSYYTYGEYALYMKKKYALKIPIKVIRLKKYKRNRHFLKYRYPIYRPSPNLPTYESTQCYWAIVFLEATYFDLGRNGSHPFCIFGHPKISNERLPPKFKGVEWTRFNFIGKDVWHKDKFIYGFRLNIINYKQYDPVQIGYELLSFFAKQYKQHSIFRFTGTRNKQYFLDILTGNSSFRHSILSGIPYQVWSKHNKKKIKKLNSQLKKTSIY